MKARKIVAAACGLAFVVGLLFLGGVVPRAAAETSDGDVAPSNLCPKPCPLVRCVDCTCEKDTLICEEQLQAL